MVTSLWSVTDSTFFQSAGETLSMMPNTALKWLGVLCALDGLISLYPVYKYYSICCNYPLITTVLSLMGNNCAQIIKLY